jgi:diadenosine tetraphosphate (Ap4A) HIT family hydrolase
MNFFCQQKCGICDEINGESFVDGYDKIVSEKKNIIAETDNFLVIPSIGPLNDSHIMLVPKKHVNSFNTISNNIKNESREILYKLNNFIIENTNKSLIFFESGAGKNIDHSGGCIFHAHIHCVYYTQEFETALNKEIKFNKNSSQSLDYDIENGYVWYMNNKYDEFLCNNPLLPSQFLRYLYYSSNSIHGHWNWRRDNNIDGVLKVIKRYSDFSL